MLLSCHYVHALFFFLIFKSTQKQDSFTNFIFHTAFTLEKLRFFLKRMVRYIHISFIVCHCQLVHFYPFFTFTENANFDVHKFNCSWRLSHTWFAYVKFSIKFSQCSIVLSQTIHVYFDLRTLSRVYNVNIRWVLLFLSWRKHLYWKIIMYSLLFFYWKKRNMNHIIWLTICMHEIENEYMPYVLNTQTIC